jgi:hypothetical protein
VLDEVVGVDADEDDSADCVDEEEELLGMDDRGVTLPVGAACGALCLRAFSNNDSSTSAGRDESFCMTSERIAALLADICAFANGVRKAELDELEVDSE